MTLSLIIRCYNEERHIGRLLNGIMEQTVKDAEIIIVDSGSTDATLSIASQYPVKILSIPSNEFSFGRSLNIGCRAATGGFLVFASAHVYPLYEDWLACLIGPFSDPAVALSYGKQCGDKKTKFSERQVFRKWFPGQSNFAQAHPFCNNANAAVKRSVWEQLPYDETLTGLEDIDWAAKVMRIGYRIAYVAEAEIVHAHDELNTQIYNRYRREAMTLRQIFPQEQFSLWDFCRLFVGNAVSDGYHAWRQKTLRAEALNIFTFRLMQFYGTYRGFTQRGPLGAELKRKLFYPNEERKQIDKVSGGTDRADQRISYADLSACAERQKRVVKYIPR
jgi:rhamnosyltransferase